MKDHIIKYEGDLDLNGFPIPCYILEDGTRVLSGRGMQNTLNISNQDAKSEELKAGGELSRFLSSKWFNSLIINKYELEHFLPIICYKGNQKINGYEATVLVDLCNIILEARENGETKTPRQKAVAKQCEILIRAFAKIGIIALIDEATGYQYDREKKGIPFEEFDKLDKDITIHKGTPSPNKIGSGDEVFDLAINKAIKKGKPPKK